MANFFKDNADLQFYFERGIPWDDLVRLTELDFRAPDGFKSTGEAVTFYREIAEMVGEFVAEEIAPRAAAIDREGVRFADGEAVLPDAMQDIFDRIRELELHGMCLPRELGGMNAPLLLYFANSEVMARADVSVMAHHGFHGGMAMAMLVFSLREGSSKIDPETARIVETRWRREIEEIVRGEAWGSMDITEPHAGSDMAQLRAVGDQDEQGNWYVTGEKTFITSGHGKYHFVIARTEKASDPDDPFAGLSGLSMFMVPAWREDADGSRTRFICVDRVEEKLGHHGSVTANLVYERAPAQLIGQRGEGFRHMLTLMNNARLGVGFECIGLCEAAHRTALAYAQERSSMGKTLDKHEMIADYLDEMRVDICGLRALGMHGAWHEEMGHKLALVAKNAPPGTETRELERRADRHQRAARRATPLLKYLAAEKAVEMARRCLQIHGGNGYMREFQAEKLVRDALVMPIYEGTSQIQALMAMKDALSGIMKNPSGFVRRLAQARWRSVSARDPLDRRLARIEVLSASAQQYLVTRTAGDKFRSLGAIPIAEWPRKVFRDWDPKRDFACAMLHAERLTRLLADEHIAELLVEQAHQHPDRRALAERYLERAETRCRHLHAEISTLGGSLLAEIAGRAAGPTSEAAE